MRLIDFLKELKRTNILNTTITCLSFRLKRFLGSLLPKKRGERLDLKVGFPSTGGHSLRLRTFMAANLSGTVRYLGVSKILKMMQLIP